MFFILFHRILTSQRLSSSYIFFFFISQLLIVAWRDVSIVCLWIQCVCGVIKPQWGLKAWQSSSDPRPTAAALAEHNWKVFMRSWHLDIWTGFPIIQEGKWWRSFIGVWHLCTVWQSSEVLCGCIKSRPSFLWMICSLLTKTFLKFISCEKNLKLCVNVHA